MKRLLPTSWFLCKHCLRSLGSFALWTTWLLLGVLLIFLLKIALSRELAVPAWVIHRLENKHAARGLISHFGGVTLDPHGRILLTDVRVHSTRFSEPLLTARSVEVALNPWALLSGDFAASEIFLRGADLHLPPILSPSGRDESVLTDLTLALEIKDRDLTIRQLSTRYANLTLTARGTLTIPPPQKSSRPEADAVVDYLLKTYLHTARLLATHAPTVAAFDTPHLDLLLSSHPQRIATTRIHLGARGARLPSTLIPSLPAGEHLDLGPFNLTTTLPLVSDQPWATRIQLSLAQLAAPGGLRATDAQLSLLASLQPGWKPTPRSLDLALGRLIVQEHAATPLNARVTGTLPHLRAQLGLRFLDEPWTLSGDLDLSARSGTVSASTRITPALIDHAGRQIKRDLSAIIQPAAPAPFSATADLSPGWKLAHARGHLASGPVHVRGVDITATAADFSYTGSALAVERILLKTPESEARGSYNMDTRTNDFRFLLSGSLRPPDIAGWFGPWWPSFWSHFDFTTSVPPSADISIAGRWGKPYDTVIFLHADAPKPIIRTVPFDHVRTTLFIRPGYYDGLELVASRDGHTARGTFTRSENLTKNALDYQSFDLTTDLDLHEDARIFGTTGTDIIAPFTFSRPPVVTATGKFTGPGSPEGEHQRAKIKIESTGPFTFLGFPLSNLTTTATLDDDDLQLPDLRVGFAEGYVTGRARLSGRDDQRRLGFDASLENASLGQAIHTLETYGAFRKNQAQPQTSKVQQRPATGRLNLRLSGDGNYKDPYSFIGSGSGEISGAELAQINLLGGLSDILRAVRLNFTSLRLNSAQANFKLDGRQLDFSELKITGPSAAIDATGLYRLDLQQMNFDAKVSPFDQSRNPLASAVGLVLTPFSSILELRLSGSLDAPRWRFAYGPSSLLRSITGKKDNFEETPPTPAPTPPKTLQPPPALRRR
ncbi:AsmA-like C-terminal region-containing protein [Nibricoccus aquaticus]|nr:AsmA-like C-terminal region-containing protein [Nibricoccus aquaticus]